MRTRSLAPIVLEPSPPPAISAPRDSARAIHVAVIGGLVALFALEVLRTAWLSDDAYITFRVVRNLLDGFGPRFNVAERVQVYTHPLWMLALAAAHAASGEPYYSTLVLSLGLAVGALLVLAFALTRGAFAAALVLILAIASRSFVDYATSGLENPLSSALLAAFVAVSLRAEGRPRGALLATSIAALVVLDRMDQALLVAPLLALAWYEAPRRGKLLAVTLGLAPFAAWEVFSVLYYGFPFPNTAYAKLGSGLPAAVLARQGGWYLVEAVRSDPVTAFAIVAGAAWGLVGSGGRRHRALALGIALYLVYIVKIGGDFMSGRFLTGPFVLALGLLAGLELRDTRRSVLVAAGVGLAVLLAPHHPWTSGPLYGMGPERADWFHGIADERAVYYPYSGLLRATRAGPADQITHPWVDAALRAKQAGPSVVVVGNVGFFGYFAGRDVHLVDRPALVDPLLARLPAQPKDKWRIGHFDRAVPDGYVDSLAQDRNVIQDTAIHAYYDELRAVVRDPLLAPARLASVFRLNLGGASSLSTTPR